MFELVAVVISRSLKHILDYTQWRSVPSSYIGKLSRIPTIHVQIKPVTTAAETVIAAAWPQYLYPSTFDVNYKKSKA
jgi:hypothetical protein